MILYHGSNMDIREIDLSMSKVGKDFDADSIFQPTKNKHSNLQNARRNS